VPGDGGGSLEGAAVVERRQDGRGSHRGHLLPNLGRAADRADTSCDRFGHHAGMLADPAIAPGRIVAREVRPTGAGYGHGIGLDAPGGRRLAVGDQLLGLAAVPGAEPACPGRAWVGTVVLDLLGL
jgi:hypothetical protein